jgi:hypothetical protein
VSLGDPHRFKQRLKNATQKIENSGKISEHNTEVLLDFREYMESQDMNPGVISCYISIYRFIFEKGEEEDLVLDGIYKEYVQRIVKKINNEEITRAKKAALRQYHKAVRKLIRGYLTDKFEENSHASKDIEEKIRDLD